MSKSTWIYTKQILNRIFFFKFYSICDIFSLFLDTPAAFVRLFLSLYDQVVELLCAVPEELLEIADELVHEALAVDLADHVPVVIVPKSPENKIMAFQISSQLQPHQNLHDDRFILTNYFTMNTNIGKELDMNPIQFSKKSNPFSYFTMNSNPANNFVSSPTSNLINASSRTPIPPSISP